MTLNIALTSRHAIYLSADFRLSYVDSSGRKSSYSDELSTQKLIPVCKFNWYGMVSFAGRAVTAFGQPVGSWIAEQLKAEKLNETMNQVIARLETANQWIARCNGNRDFSMVVVGFNGRQPFFRLLTNCHNANLQYISDFSRCLRLYKHSGRAETINTFGAGHVSESDKTRLLTHLKANDHPAIPSAIAEVNAKASGPNSTVSHQCVIGYLLPTGDGQIIPYVDTVEGYLPDWVIRELTSSGSVGCDVKLDDEGKPLKPGFVGMTLRIEDAGTTHPSMAKMIALRNVQRLVTDPNHPAIKGGQVFSTIFNGNATSERATLQSKATDGTVRTNSIRFPIWK